jgi:thiol-disulfide isomerase/thioredoxin
VLPTEGASIAATMKRSIVLACLMLVSGFSLAKEKNKESSLPDASLSQVRWGDVINDVPFDKDGLAGKVVVVEEWGMKCGPCIASLPDMAKLARSNAKKGLIVVGLECQNSPKDEILKLLKKNRIEYPVMKGGSAPGGTGTIPHVCVFNTEGKLVWNGNPHDEDFERAVKKELRAIKQ